MHLHLKKLPVNLWERTLSIKKAVLILGIYGLFLVGTGLWFYNYFLVPYEVRSVTERNLQQSLREVDIRSGNADARVDLGWALYEKYIQTKQKTYLDQARLEYLQALELDAHHVAAKYNLALVYAETNKLHEAQSLLQEIVSTFPRHYLAHYLLGNILARQEKYPEAVQEYKASLAIAPGAANVYQDLGVALEKMGQVEQAKAAFEQASRYGLAMNKDE